MNPNQEVVAIVDEQNNVAGSATRGEMRARKLPHRATYILVFNRRGELFIQKRTQTKDIYPGYFDVAAGGVVLAGESYEESAARELLEELGIDGTPLIRHFDHYHADDNNKVWGRIFSCIHEGPFVLQKEEVDRGFFLSPEKVLALGRTEPFTPDGIEVLQRYLEMKDAV